MELQTLKNKIMNEFENTQDGLTDAEYYNKYFEMYNDVQYLPDVNSIIPATFMSRDKNEAVFATNYKSDIIVRLNNNELELVENLKHGQDVEIFVTNVIDTKKETIMYGSVEEVYHFNLMQKVNITLQSLYEKKEVFTGTPVNYDTYGYDIVINVDYEEILIRMPHLLADVNKLPDPNSIIGQEIQFKVEKNDRNEFIASRKAHLLEVAKKELKELVIGNIYTGFVTDSRPFGVFVQIGYNTGMVHRSNLSESAIEMLDQEKVEPGMLIEVYLKDIFKDKLTLTQIWRDSLWDTIKVGDIIEGKIVSIKPFGGNDFGLLVKFDYETKGMIHSSNLDKGIDSFKLGQKITTKVEGVNKGKRQITLVKPE